MKDWQGRPQQGRADTETKLAMEANVMKWSLFVFLIAGLLLTGCTQKNLYNSVEGHHRQKCKTQPPPLDQECLKAPHKSYEDYLKEREEILRED